MLHSLGHAADKAFVGFFSRQNKILVESEFFSNALIELSSTANWLEAVCICKAFEFMIRVILLTLLL